MDDQQVQEELSKVNINGQEYDATEAQNLIELGSRTREAETKYNTSFDKVWPEYGRSRDQVRSLETQLSEAKTQLQEYQNKKEAGTDTKQDLTEAKEAALKIEDLEKNFIKREELDTYLQQRESQKDAVQNILSEASKLETEIDGSDGRPKFNKKQVLAYASAYGFDDLSKAYEDMHSDVLTGWKDQQIQSKKQPGLKTLQPTGVKKAPEKVSVTDDNRSDLLKEALWGTRE